MGSVESVQKKFQLVCWQGLVGMQMIFMGKDGRNKI
jgi:hypothetical protein